MSLKTMSTFALAGALALTAGCFPEEDSCNIRTAGIYVQYEVTEEDGDATAKATFWTGDTPGGTYLVLGEECNDQIAVNGTSLGHKSGNPEYYEAAIDVADSYEFVFTREGENPYSSTATTRDEFDITAPTAGEAFSRENDTFDIEWDPAESGEEIELLVSGDCIDDFPSLNGEDINDNGSYTVNAGDIEPGTSDDELETCTAEILLTRSLDGELDTALKGEIVGKTVDRSSFESQP